MDSAVLTSSRSPRTFPNHGFPAGLSGSCVILKNSVRKVFFGFMLAVCLLGKWFVCLWLTTKITRADEMFAIHLEVIEMM